ncbi:MAG TPA: hypothetical protein VFS02_14560 [Telluria sp.]|nr:hypothetical protein [Telluria sp.]
MTCFHAGLAQPLLQNPRVTVSGMPTVTMAATYSVAACTLALSGATPCATANWITAAVRITSNGQPLLLFDSQATCIPTGTPLLITATQTRASGM